MAEKLNFKSIRGVTVHEVCGYCKGKRRLPGGRYVAEGEVVDCPVCDGRGVNALIISLEQFQTLMTMTKKRVKPRGSWKVKPKPPKKPKKRAANS